ncbi:hypothetical protein Tco_0685720 [Tanacetum coccineum]
MEESLIKFMAESAKIHDENSNLIKEIRSSTDAAIRNQGAFEHKEDSSCDGLSLWIQMDAQTQGRHEHDQEFDAEITIVGAEVDDIAAET